MSPPIQSVEESVELTPTSVKVRGTDIVNIITLLCMVGVSMWIYAHAEDGNKRTASANAAQVEVANALKEVASAQREANKNQRFLTCIVSRPELERKKEFEYNNSFCQQVSR
jgi:hypothetical protein